MRKIYSFLACMLLAAVSLQAADFVVTSNNTTKWLKLYNPQGVFVTPDSVIGADNAKKTYYYSGLQDAVHTIEGFAYSAAMDTVSNGTIKVDVSRQQTLSNVDYNLLTITLSVNTTMSYKITDPETGSVKTICWKYGDDYVFENISVTARDGYNYEVTVGKGSGYNASFDRYENTILAFEGCSYSLDFVPTEKHKAEGYGRTSVGQTINANASAVATLQKVRPYSVTVGKDVNFFLGVKGGGAGASSGTGTVHFKPFKEIKPDSIVAAGDNNIYHYTLTNKQEYNFRAWQEGKTPATGYFTFDTLEAKVPELTFTAAELPTMPLDSIEPTLTGTRVHDIYLNINERGHLNMQVGDQKNLLAQRNWQVINTTTGNYFMEPNYRYTVYNLDGKEDTTIVAIDNAYTSTDPWASIRAKANGTAIVTVTYEAMNANYYTSSGNATAGFTVKKNPFYGGEDWGAIWPENTGVFVVTVGQTETGIETGMKINEAYNAEKMKIAGAYVDAEHDVFYYLAEEEGATYTFKPAGVKTVEIMYPTIGEHAAVYDKGFTEVKAAENGTYTLLLKKGRNIARLTNEAGQSVYQVLTAKPCTMEFKNTTHPGKTARPGDRIEVQFGGLFHPANKLAGIYNMSAYVTFANVPNGTALILSPNQYAFASTASAQKVTIDIPVTAEPVDGKFSLGEGVIQVSGFGDPIGNHRNTTKEAGRSPNFTAVSHQTYFGKLPALEFPLLESRKHVVVFDDIDADYTLNVMTVSGDTLPAEKLKSMVQGTYNYAIKREGYATVYSSFTLSDSQNDTVYVTTNIQPLTAEGVWDGTTKLAADTTETGVYRILNAANLAWFADTINNGKDQTLKAQLEADINLAGFEWTAIGTSSKNFKGEFDGQNHTINGLYINATTVGQGLFGTIAGGAVVKNVTVHGYVKSTSNNTAGVIGSANVATIENVHFYGKVEIEQTGSSAPQFTGGIVGNLYGNGTSISHVSNHGNIYGFSSVAGIAGRHFMGDMTEAYNWGACSGTALVGGIVGTASPALTNVYNAGEMIMRPVVNATTGASTTATTRGAIAGTAAFNKLTNGYANHAYNNESNAQNKTTVILEEVANGGSLALKLGEGWGQNIGIDPYPVFSGAEVLTLTVANNINDYTELYYANANDSVSVAPYEIDGYRFKSWAGIDGTDIKVAFTKDTTILANYVKLYTIEAGTKVANDSYRSEGDKGGVVTGAGIYEEGEEFTLRAQAQAGYRFKGWNNGVEADSIVMTADKDVNITALFVAVYTVTVETETKAGVTSVSCLYEAGETATVTATLKDNYIFKGWKGIVANDSYRSDDTDAMTFSFVIEQDTTFTALYAAQYTITVEAIVANDSYRSEGGIVANDSYRSGENIGGTVEGSGLYEEDTEVTLRAIAAEGYEFQEWGDGVTDAERTITVIDDETYVAIFRLPAAVENIQMDEVQTISIYTAAGQYLQTITATPRDAANAITTHGAYILSTEHGTLKVVK